MTDSINLDENELAEFHEYVVSIADYLETDYEDAYLDEDPVAQEFAYNIAFISRRLCQEIPDVIDSPLYDVENAEKRLKEAQNGIDVSDPAGFSGFTGIQIWYFSALYNNIVQHLDLDYSEIGWKPEEKDPITNHSTPAPENRRNLLELVESISTYLEDEDSSDQEFILASSAGPSNP